MIKFRNSLIANPAILIIIFIHLLIQVNGAIDTSKPWHPLQQVSKASNDLTSVDENKNSVIDESDTLKLIGGVAFIGDGTIGTVLAIKGSPTSWSAVDFYSGNTNFWGIGRDSNGDFYIDRSGVGNAIKIDKNNLNVGIGKYPNHKLDIKGDPGVPFSDGILFLELDSKGPGRGAISVHDDFFTSRIFYLNNYGTLDLGPSTEIRLNPAGKSYFMGGEVGIGITEPSSKLEVNGNVELTNILDNDGSNFFDNGCGDNQHIVSISSDGTINCAFNSGDIFSVNAGFGLIGGGSSGDITLSVDSNLIQRRVSSVCGAGSSIRQINSDGSVICEDDTDTDTNANTICSGTNTYLDGDGNCDSGFFDADGVDSVGVSSWNGLKSQGMPAGFADDVDNVGDGTEVNFFNIPNRPPGLDNGDDVGITIGQTAPNAPPCNVVYNAGYSGEPNYFQNHPEWPWFLSPGSIRVSKGFKSIVDGYLGGTNGKIGLEYSGRYCNIDIIDGAVVWRYWLGGNDWTECYFYAQSCENSEIISNEN